MLLQSGTLEERGVLDTAAKMCVAARTAPKAKGVDEILTLVLTGEEKNLLADKMEEMGVRYFKDKAFVWYGRDAENVRKSQAVVLIGARKSYRGVGQCALCGFKNCEECKKAGGNCAHLFLDLGIALSSAVLKASGDNVDNRMMWSAGKAAAEMQYVEGEAFWIGIPLNASGKNIYFDRK
ncbi:ferredoxin domain-containing protein [[Clostridium] hylemonae]|uniref:ferredoxin domain-containing protein n=1 Tax=[Clostridium] hylemonae TaxID=89153 RepID=UPI0011062650|nr:DUF2148 domain-containing protein [[Clostridium] hylemonae]